MKCFYRILFIRVYAHFVHPCLLSLSRILNNFNIWNNLNIRIFMHILIDQLVINLISDVESTLEVEKGAKHETCKWKISLQETDLLWHKNMTWKALFNVDFIRKSFGNPYNIRLRGRLPKPIICIISESFLTYMSWLPSTSSSKTISRSLLPSIFRLCNLVALHLRRSLRK